MILQDKITVFLNKAQNKVANLMLATSVDLFESYTGEENSKLAIELIDVITCLQDELLDWTDYEIESTIDYYNSKAQLIDIAIVNFEDNSTYVVGNSTSAGDSSWIAPFTALSLRVDSNNYNLLSEIDRLDQEINNLDFSNLIPQEILDEIDANTLSRHTHSNKTILDSINQGHLDSITLNNAHRANSYIHVTSNQKTSWDNKVSQTQLIDGLASKANTSHIHAIADVTGLGEALVNIVPEKGDKGDDGITPTILGGTITEGEYYVNINNDNPQYPVLSLVIPAPKDGEDFHIDVFGLSQNRLSSLYNNSDVGYSFLGTDNGMLYFRKPYDSEGNFISAITTSGWSGVQFGGFNGWSPSFKLVIRDSGEIVLAISGWFGGSGPVPTLGLEYTMYLGTDGYTPYIEQAINIRGLQGEDGEPGTAGKIMFPDISDVIANRYLYDDSPIDTIFLDSSAGAIYRKKSETIGDWSDGFQWKGDKGNQGPAGSTGPTGADSTVPGPQGPIGESGQGYTWKGQWNDITPFVPYDTVYDLGSTYNCITSVTGGNNPATNTAFELFASKGVDGIESIYTENFTVQLLNGKTFGKYTNGQVVPAIGMTASQLLKDIAIEYLLPSFSFFSSPQTNTVEVGTTISTPMSFTFGLNNSINVSPNTLKVIDVTNANTILIQNQPLTSPISTPIGLMLKTVNAAINSWKGQATNTNSQLLDSPNFSITWRLKTFYGAISTTFPTDSAGVRGLASSLWDTSNSFSITLNQLKYSIALRTGKNLASVVTQNNENITSNFANGGTVNVLLADGITSQSYTIYNFTSATIMNVNANVILS